MVCDIDQQAVEQLVAIGAAAGTYAQIGKACDVIFTIFPTKKSFKRFFSVNKERQEAYSRKTGVRYVRCYAHPKQAFYFFALTFDSPFNKFLVPASLSPVAAFHFSSASYLFIKKTFLSSSPGSAAARFVLKGTTRENPALLCSGAGFFG